VSVVELDRHEDQALGARSELDVLERAARDVARVAWANRPKASLGPDLLQLQRTYRMVDAARLALLGAFDASGQYRRDAQPSAATWLAATTKADRRRVRHQIGVARKARTMPRTEDAYQCGLIGFEHVSTLSRAINSRTAEFFAEAEAELVAAAQTLDFDLFCRAVRAWMDFVDPDGAEERRRAHASRTFDGMVRIDAWLDAIGGTEFLAELHRLEKHLFDTDWAEARARLGDNAKASDLARTAEQRRADAFIEMARRSATSDTPGQPPRWVLNVMMGYTTFWNELAAADGEPDPTVENDHDDADPDDADPDADIENDLDQHDNHAAGPPRPLPDWWKAIDLRPGAGLAHTRFYDTMCELEDCTPISPRTAITLGLAGTIRRIVFGPDSHILDFGHAVDYFHGPLREAIIIRDRFCRDQGCGLPGRDCQIDHIIPRSKHGPTAEPNGECKCGTGNRMKGNRTP